MMIGWERRTRSGLVQALYFEDVTAYLGAALGVLEAEGVVDVGLGPDGECVAAGVSVGRRKAGREGQARSTKGARRREHNALCCR